MLLWESKRYYCIIISKKNAFDLSFYVISIKCEDLSNFGACMHASKGQRLPEMAEKRTLSDPIVL